MNKFIQTILMPSIMVTTIKATAQNTPATTVKTTFHRQTSVSIDIHADTKVIWALLTNAQDYPRWNTTITAIEGEIKLGKKIKLKSTLDTKRTFKLKVKKFEPAKQLSWGDGKGIRVYTLTDKGNGVVNFSMIEKIGGLMFPMYAKYIPSFDASFNTFANDLKKEAEMIMKTK